MFSPFPYRSHRGLGDGFVVMRMAIFLLVSLTLHATALSYPVLFLAPRGELLLSVVILASTERSEGIPAENGGTGGGKERQAGLTPRELVQQPVGANEVITPERQEEPKFDTAAITTPVASETIVASEGIAAASDGVQSEETWILASPGVVATGDVGEGSNGAKGPTGGLGYGDENRTGTGGGGIGFAGVSYAYNPKPEYPDRARREGREGTVILRVLVDEEGRSKSVEVNRSSGFEALDKAAMNTVRRWRFYAARYGDKRVESWVRIPIMFRLADLQD